MNTPAHLLIGAALMGRRGHAGIVAAAFAGALMPDLSLYLMGGVALFLLRIPPDRVFNELYFSDAWQTVFAIDNSVIVWGMLLALALWRRVPWAIALTGAALVHIALDLPLHHDDGRAHFWPLSYWIFESPVSYWDRNHGASWIAPVEAAVAIAAAVALWLRRVSIGVSLITLGLVGLEIWIVRQWLFVFATA